LIGGGSHVTGDAANGAQTAFDLWMNSTARRKDFFSQNEIQFGVGYVYDSRSDCGGDLLRARKSH